MASPRLVLVLVAMAGGAACAGAPPAPGAALGPSEAARQVEALERAYHAALAVGDRAREEELLAPEYRFVTPFGDVLDRQATLDDPLKLEFVSRVDDLQLHVSESGDTVVVTMKATAIGPSSRMMREVRTIRVWGRRGSVWRAVFGQQTSLPGTAPNGGRTTVGPATARRDVPNW